MDEPEAKERKSRFRKEVKWQFFLYIAGSAPNSQLATYNLIAILEEHLPGKYQLEIVDIFETPDKALQEYVFVTPTLIKAFPPPRVSITGRLSDKTRVLKELGLRQHPE